jgi:hypothetical protein
MSEEAATVWAAWSGDVVSSAGVAGSGDAGRGCGKLWAAAQACGWHSRVSNTTVVASLHSDPAQHSLCDLKPSTRPRHIIWKTSTCFLPARKNDSHMWLVCTNIFCDEPTFLTYYIPSSIASARWASGKLRTCSALRTCGAIGNTCVWIELADPNFFLIPSYAHVHYVHGRAPKNCAIKRL